MPTRTLARRAIVCLGLLAPLAPPTLRAAPPLVDWADSLVLATGGGEKGPWRQNDSRYDYVDDGTLAFAPDGGLFVAWVDQGRKDVLLQALDAQGRRQGEPVNVSRNGDTFSWLPRLAVPHTNPDHVHALWQEIIFSGGSHGGDILYARSLDGGRSFSAPINLSRSIAGDGKGRLDRDTWSNGSLDLAVAPDGAVLAAWTAYDGSLWLARSNDGGASFGQPDRVAGDERLPARGPSLAPGPGGVVYLAWAVGEDASADIRVAQSVDGGRSFGPPRLAGTGPSRADAPRLALDAGGTLHLVYAEHPGSADGQAVVRHASSRRGAAGFGAPRTISDPQRGAAYPFIAADPRGLLYVAWEDFATGATRPIGLALTCSTNGGESFAAPSVVAPSMPATGTSGSHQGLLGKKLDAHGDGTVALVNSGLARGQGSAVWLMRGQPAAQGACAPAVKDSGSGP